MGHKLAGKGCRAVQKGMLRLDVPLSAVGPCETLLLKCI